MHERFPKKGKTPAPEHLFQVDSNAGKSNKKMKEELHTFVTKALFLSKRGRPCVSIAIEFLIARVKEPDMDDWKNLL